MNLVGCRFKRLVVISPAPKGDDGKTRWNCRCDCTTEITVNAGELRSGYTGSCGCLHRERATQARRHGRAPRLAQHDPAMRKRKSARLQTLRWPRHPRLRALAQ